MANGKTGGAGELLTAVTEAALSANFKADDLFLDGDVIIKELGKEGSPKGVITKVVKLKNTEELPVPSLNGKFLGYEQVEVSSPDGKRKSRQNFVLIEVRPGIVAKHLGLSQIMQGLAGARIGQRVSIIKPVAEDIKIGKTRDGKEKAVKVFHVITYETEGTESGYTGAAAPFPVETWDKETGEVQHD